MSRPMESEEDDGQQGKRGDGSIKAIEVAFEDALAHGAWSTCWLFATDSGGATDGTGPVDCQRWDDPRTRRNGGVGWCPGRRVGARDVQSGRLDKSRPAKRQTTKEACSLFVAVDLSGRSWLSIASVHSSASGAGMVAGRHWAILIFFFLFKDRVLPRPSEGE